jgi:SHS2 domain-containing protein
MTQQLEPGAPRWEHFDHGADIGVRGVGATREAAFEQLALALTAVITDPAAVRPLTGVEIRCAPADDDVLAVDWLNALVFEMATRRMLFGRFDVAIDAGGLRALAWGEPVDPRRHHPAVEVKGATYTALRVGNQADGTWLAQCIVDV